MGMAAQSIKFEQGRLDWLGVLCSFGCAVHCAAMPVLMATLPSLTSLQWLGDPLFHQIVAILCGVLVARAIVPGYRTHRDGRVVTLAGLGLGLLFTAAFILPDTCCLGLAKMQTELKPKLQAKSETEHFSQRMVLVSSNNANAPTTLGHFQLRDAYSLVGQDQVSPLAVDSATCQHSGSTFSRPLLTAAELAGQLGAANAQKLIQAQPYLSPIGGLFLIVAHILNIQLRCCRRQKCRNS